MEAHAAVQAQADHQVLALELDASGPTISSLSILFVLDLLHSSLKVLPEVTDGDPTISWQPPRLPEAGRCVLLADPIRPQVEGNRLLEMSPLEMIDVLRCHLLGGGQLLGKLVEQAVGPKDCLVLPSASGPLRDEQLRDVNIHDALSMLHIGINIRCL